VERGRPGRGDKNLHERGAKGRLGRNLSEGEKAVSRRKCWRVGQGNNRGTTKRHVGFKKDPERRVLCRGLPEINSEHLEHTESDRKTRPGKKEGGVKLY